MTRLGWYTVTIDGVAHMVRLLAEDAERLGAVATPARAAKLPRNKLRTPCNK